jgi:hypothetical protein
MRKYALAVLVALIAAGSARPAFAILQFLKVFDEVYLKDHENKEFVETGRSAKMKCMICHQGKSRKNHNPYGIHLVERLDKKKDIRDVEKIKTALAEVGKLHSDPDDDKSPTYDELIKAGTFPGGTLEEVMKEPEAK